MKTIKLTLLCLLTVPLAYGQMPNKKTINELITPAESAFHLRFLASDELRGRDTGSHEIDVAARYIAEYFRQSGLQPLPGADEYFQAVSLMETHPPAKGILTMGDKKFNQGQELLVLRGSGVNLDTDLVFANYGLEADLEGLDLQDKILVVKAGSEEAVSPRQFFGLVGTKQQLAKSKGAAAVIELYNSPGIPWPMLLNYLNQPQLGIDDGKEEKAALPYIWLQDSKNELLVSLKEKQVAKASLEVSDLVKKPIPSKNVLGMIEGTDEKLKNEFLLLSAHYDHVGVGPSSDPADSIFNGARDNAVGTAAVLCAARTLGAYPPKRSVIFAAWTAEEKGLLGSAYYAENPLIPLNQTIYNLNIDGAGYNDTTVVTVIGLERTSAQNHIREATETYGLTAISDPAPEQGLFDRSDNVNFAKKGIPAPTYSTGFRSFDDEIMKYYHQVTDEPEGLNFNYLLKYFRSYALAALKIANDERRPSWTVGDKYEVAGKQLYGD